MSCRPRQVSAVRFGVVEACISCLVSHTQGAANLGPAPSAAIVVLYNVRGTTRAFEKCICACAAFNI